jgi:FMN-dependent NADH-azoreductase
MKKILVINASARSAISHSRSLSKYFTNYLETKSSDARVSYRDLGSSEVPHISEQWIDADIKTVEERTESEAEILKLSDLFLNEVHSSDIIVIATPMYNWSIPSVLKAYIDQIMRFNETFSVNLEKGGQQYIGLLKEKRLILLLSRGSRGYGPGERNEYMDFQSTYLKMVFGIMGIQQIYEISINGTSGNDLDLKKETDGAYVQIQNLIDKELTL